MIAHGPFNSEAFPKKQPRIIVIVPDIYKGEAEIFIKQFTEGVKGSRYFEKGFLRLYHLNNFSRLDIKSFPIRGEVADCYKEACLSVLQQDYDLAFIIIEERFHSLIGDKNPYLVSKSTFMSQGVPVQEIEIETIRGRGLDFTLNNIGLACYAKLGGIPFTISSLQPMAHELVFGLGMARAGEGRLDDSASRFIGITTVFNSDGNYLLNNLSREIGYDNYQDELKRSLTEVISEVSKRHAWIDGDPVRLIFHQQFKRFKNKEIQAVKDYVSSIVTKYNVEFAFVNLEQKHPFMLFDLDQKGIDDPVNWGKMKGEFTPERGLFVEMTRNSGLMTATDPRHILSYLHGVPKPLSISIHKESTFKDISYLSRQVFEFTCLSWRGFNPTHTPVTIMYSNLIAELLGELRRVTNWNSDIVRTKLRFSR